MILEDASTREGPGGGGARGFPNSRCILLSKPNNIEIHVYNSRISGCNILTKYCRLYIYSANAFPTCTHKYINTYIKF